MAASGNGDYCMGQIVTAYIYGKNDTNNYRYKRIGRVCTRCHVYWDDAVWKIETYNEQVNEVTEL